MTSKEKEVLCDALLKIIEMAVKENDEDYNHRLSNILKPMERELGIADEMDKRLTDQLSPLKLMAMVLDRILKEKKEKGKDD